MKLTLLAAAVAALAFVTPAHADAWDEAAAQVFADSVYAGGELAFETHHLELRAVLGVFCPFATEVKSLTAFDAGLAK